MNNLSQKMQERLDKWKKNTLVVPSTEKLRLDRQSRRNGRGDFGDATTLEEWEEEYRISQRRR